MAVQADSEIEIARPRDVVAAFAADPSNATLWYENIKAVTWKTAPPLAVGSVVEFVAQFLGRRLTYAYEFAVVDPGHRVVMRTAQGPFPMETTYLWADTPDGGTRMTLQNRGEPTGFSRVATPFLRTAMKRATTKDLRRLKAVLEANASEPGGA